MNSDLEKIDKARELIERQGEELLKLRAENSSLTSSLQLATERMGAKTAEIEILESRNESELAQKAIKEIRRLSNLVDHLRQGKDSFSYVPQDIALDLLEMLEGAGFGKPGTSNTLYGMTQQAISRINQLESDLQQSATRAEMQAQEVERLQQVVSKLYCSSCHSTGWIDSDGNCGNCELGRVKGERERLKEPLKWAVEFIRCNFPNAAEQYLDFQYADNLSKSFSIEGVFTYIRHRNELLTEQVVSLTADIESIQADHASTITSLCNYAWQKVYGEGKTDWEYPMQAIRHLVDYADEKEAEIEGYKESQADKQRLTKEIAGIIGHDAENPSLCDVVAILKREYQEVPEQDRCPNCRNGIAYTLAPYAQNQTEYETDICPDCCGSCSRMVADQIAYKVQEMTERIASLCGDIKTLETDRDDWKNNAMQRAVQMKRMEGDILRIDNRLVSAEKELSEAKGQITSLNRSNGALRKEARLLHQENERLSNSYLAASRELQQFKDYLHCNSIDEHKAAVDKIASEVLQEAMSEIELEQQVLSLTASLAAAKEAQEDAERQLYFLRGVFNESADPEDAPRAIQSLIQPLSDEDRKTFNMLIRWARMLGKNEVESRVAELESLLAAATETARMVFRSITIKRNDDWRIPESPYGYPAMDYFVNAGYVERHADKRWYRWQSSAREEGE